MRDIGVNLTGGGARAAYQAGVLQALGELLADMKLVGEKNPLCYLSGTSAGAINSSFMASHAEDMALGTRRLAELWQELTPEQVYATGVMSLGSNSARWIRDLTFGPLFKRKWAEHLLDTTPLYNLLLRRMPFENIQTNLDADIIKGVTCSSYSYNTGELVTFVQAQRELLWNRRKRRTQNTKLSAEHILASCSIPLLFPPTQIDGLYYGDGGFRNTAPTSATIKLGARKMLMIGVRYMAPESENEGVGGKPGVATIAGTILNALFMDSLELDIERLKHVNEILEAVGEGVKTERSEYNVVDFKMIRPSQNITKIAEQRTKAGLPKMIQYLLAGLGSGPQTADLASYILFEPVFTGELVKLGYQDFKARENEMRDWLLA